MTESRTLLEHLARTCTNQQENVANDSLCYILSSSKAARRALEDVLRAGRADVGTIARVSSQADHGGKIPDMEAFDEHGLGRLLIEGKFGAALTDNQPVEYLNLLEKQPAPTTLLFVAPSSRSESLWAELRQRVRQAGKNWGALTAEPKSASVDEGRHLLLTSWRELLGRIEASAQDDRTRADIGQLRGLTEHFDSDDFLPFQSDELAPQFARRLLGFGRLVDDATTRAAQEGWLKRGSTSSWPDGYGRRVSFNEIGARLAVSCDLWAVHAVTPVWLGFYDSHAEEARRKLQPLRREEPPGIIDDGEKCVLVPIKLKESAEYDSVLEAVVARLKHIAALLGPPDGSNV